MKDRVYKETKEKNCSQFFNYHKNKSKKFNADRQSPVESSFKKTK